MSDNFVPAPVRLFRIVVTMLAAFIMGLMVFLRQHRLDRELRHMLDSSRDSVDNLKRLQAQLLQSEKLASIGQLVGGAAHELNNPITAMLGYSDLLLGTELTVRQQPIAAKIGHDIRRTKSLVASLISFARQGSAPKLPTDLNSLARTALKLIQPQWEAHKIEVRALFDPQLPKVVGDSNQLLQVCVQLLGNCFQALTETRKVVSVGTARQGFVCVLSIACSSAQPSGTRAPADDGYDDDLQGLSACQGILQEHGGQISHERGEDGTLTFRVEIPAMISLARPTDSSVPVPWQSRPFA